MSPHRKQEKLTKAVLALSAVCVALMLVIAVFGLPRIFRSADNSSEFLRNGTTQAHLTKCQGTLNANWRKAYSVLGIAAFTPRDGELDPAAVAAGLPADRAEAAKEGTQRLIAAVSDDARLTDKKNPICPFVAGRPDLTPEEPVNSATERLERKLKREGG